MGSLPIWETPPGPWFLLHDFQNPSFLQGFIRVWLQKGVILRQPWSQDVLVPGPRPTGRPAGRRPGFFLFFFHHHLFLAAGPRLGGRQAPCPPRERGLSVVNNYVTCLAISPYRQSQCPAKKIWLPKARKRSGNSCISRVPRKNTDPETLRSLGNPYKTLRI